MTKLAIWMKAISLVMITCCPGTAFGQPVSYPPPDGDDRVGCSSEWSQRFVTTHAFCNQFLMQEVATHRATKPMPSVASSVNHQAKKSCRKNPGLSCTMEKMRLSRAVEHCSSARSVAIGAIKMQSGNLSQDVASSSLERNFLRAQMSPSEIRKIVGDVYTRLGFFGVKSRTKGGHPINGYLIPYKDVPTQLCSPHEFRQKILGENGEAPSLVVPNKDPYGIPQGAPISDLLANLYLIDFDVEMNALATSLGGSYVRYSDDILLILPASVEQARAIMDEMPTRIKVYGDKLLIKPEKTSLVRYTIAQDGQDCELISGKGRNGLEYLGFRFDGHNVYLRDSTMSNLHRKVAATARNQAEATIKRFADKSYAELCEMFNFEEFTKRFGRVEGFEPTSTNKKWTFWTYVVRAVEEFGPAGRKISGQVKRLRRRARHRVDHEIERALARKAKRDASPEVSIS